MDTSSALADVENLLEHLEIRYTYGIAVIIRTVLVDSDTSYHIRNMMMHFAHDLMTKTWLRIKSTTIPFSKINHKTFKVCSQLYVYN